MPKLNFPGSPTPGTIYTENGYVWKWNGTSWVSFNSLDLTSQVSGALGATYGGTGYTSYTKGDLLVGAGSTFIKLNAGANGSFLTVDSVSSSGLKWGSLTNIGTANQYQIGYYPQTGAAITGSGIGLTWNDGLLSIGNTYADSTVLTIAQNQSYLTVSNNSAIILKNSNIANVTDTGFLAPSLEFQGSYFDGTGVSYDRVRFAPQNNYGFNSGLNLEVSHDPGTPQWVQRLSLDFGGPGSSVDINSQGSLSFFNIASYYNVSNANYPYEKDPGSAIILSSQQTATASTQLFSSPSIDFFVNKYSLNNNNKARLQFVGISTAADDNVFELRIISDVIAGLPSTVFQGFPTGQFKLPTPIASTATTTGTLVVIGGAGITGNLNVGGNASVRSGSEFRIYNSGDSNYSGFKFTGATNTLYTLPTTYPSTGTSVLVSNASGALSWVSATSTSTTNADSVRVATASSSSPHPVLFTPLQSVSGSAVSANGTLVYNPSLDTLYSSAIAVTSGGFASTGSLSGNALQVTSSIGASTIYARRVIGVGLTTYLGDGVGNARVEMFDGLTNTGISVYKDGKNLAIAQLSLDGAGGGLIGLKFNASTSSSDASSAVSVGTASANTGGQLAIRATDGQNANVIRLLVLGGSGSSYVNEIAFGISASGTAQSVILRGSNASGTDIPGNDFYIQSGRSTGTASPGSIRFRISNTSASSSTLNTLFDVVRINQIQNSTNTTSGSMHIYGGLGITGNAFIGGTVAITNTSNSTSITNGSLVSSGGAGFAQSISIGGRLQLFNGSNYTAFISSASGNTVYTLPATTPSTGTSVLQSDTIGNLSWVPMTATGSGSGGSGTVSNGNQYEVAFYASTGNTVSGNSNFKYNSTANNTLILGGMTFVGSGNSSITITSVGNGGQILSTWNTLNSGLALDALNASLRIVGDTNAGTTLVDLGIYDNSGFPTGNWNSKYLFPKSTSAIFVNGLQINDATGSTTISTGSLIVSGGAGVAQSVSIGGRLQLFNNSNYTAFVSSASGNTVYTLPATSPATGTSVLQSTSAGVMSWVAMTATGGGGAAISTLPPSSPSAGSFWWDSSSGSLKVYYVDPDNDAYWVDTSGGNQYSKEKTTILLAAGYTPAASGVDTVEIPVPYSSFNGTSVLTFNVRRLFTRVGTSGSGSTVRFEVYTGTGAFIGSTIGDVSLSASSYEAATTSGFAISTVQSGNKIRLNFKNLGTEQYFTCGVELAE